MNDAFRHLVRDFVADALPQIDAIESALLAIEQASADLDAATDAAATVRRRLHTLKGNAAMMDLAAIQRVAHALEDVFEVAMHGGEAERAAALACLLAGADLLRALVGSVADGGTSEQGAAPLQSRHRAEPVSEVIQVPFGAIDELLALAGDVAAASIARPELQRGTSELRRRLVDLRMVPVSTVLDRFHRHVRDLSTERGQPLALVVDGGDVLIDKRVADRLAEPLLHIVRNAVAHGIEPPDQRDRLGKPVVGTIQISAEVDASHVVVTVADDGRGIDWDALRRRADEQHVSDGDTSGPAPHLLFTAGLSTAESVTSLAGRGVGLDVVARALRAIGGDIDVSSEPGRGATFRLTFPATRVVIRALVAEAGGERALLPATAVEAIERRGDMLEVRHDGRTVVDWRGALIPLVDARCLVARAAPAERAGLCVITSVGARRRAVVVDAALGYEDVVLQPIDAALGAPAYAANATVLAGGTVAVVLDPAQLG